MIFLIPFFLLLDSFLFLVLAGVASLVAGCAASAAGASVVLALLVSEAVFPSAGVFPSAAGPVASEDPEEFTSSAGVPPAGAGSPGLTVPTIPVVPVLAPAPEPTSAVRPPPERISTPEVVSASGSIFGAPLVAAMCTSGPLRKRPNARCGRVSRGRGAFCSAVIQATAFGSGCGTGTPKTCSLPLASPARAESG